MLRLLRGPRCGVHATSTASTCSSPNLDNAVMSNVCGDEVALRVTEVGAVEEHVGLVEDPVERHPPAAAGVGLRRRESMAVEQRAVAGGELGMVPPVPRDVDRLPRAVVGVETDGPPPQVVVGLGRAPDPRELHCP